MIMGKIFDFFKLKKKTKDKTCNEEINVKDIRNNFLYSNDNKIFCYIKIHPLNLFLLNEKEKKSIISQLAAELSSETKAFKFFSIARPVEVTGVIDDLQNLQNESINQIQKKLLRLHISNILQLTMSGDRIERQNFLIIWETMNEYAEKDLLKRANDLVNKFVVCKIKAELLNEQQIIQLATSFTNMNSSYKEDSDYDDYMPMVVGGA